jgi:hypothetical protein
VGPLLNFKFDFTTDGVSQFFLVSGPPLGPMTRLYISFSLTISCFFTKGALSDNRMGL